MTDNLTDNLTAALIKNLDANAVAAVEAILAVPVDVSDNISEKRKMVSIQVITSLTKIDGADRILCAQVLGWHTVVKVGEFKAGDKVFFFEIDSLLEAKPWNEFLQGNDFLRDATKPIRLKTVRLKRQISQGLAIPIDVIRKDYPDLPADLPVGMDCTALLNVTKWELPVAANLRGLVKGSFPFFLKKTDTERVQAYPDIIQEFQGRQVYGTLKIDGTSCTFYYRNGEFGVCSRNLDLKESDNVYWNMARRYNLPEKMATLGGNYSLQGECYGMGIQSNKLGLPDIQLAAFDVFDIDAGRYLNYDQARDIMAKLGVTPVTTVFLGEWQWDTSDALIASANEQDYANKTPAEGVIFRPVEEAYSHALDSRMAIKAISPRFLLKYGE